MFAWLVGDSSAINWGQLGWQGVALTTVGMILTGLLVPRKVMRDRIADKDRQIQYLTASVETLRQANDVLHGQNGKMVDSLETVSAALTAVEKAARHVS